MSEQQVKRVIPKEELAQSSYAELARVFPDATFIEDQNGTWRFKEDTLVGWLLDTNQVDLNSMAAAFQCGKFNGEDYMRFYRGIGYSLFSWKSRVF